MNAKTILLCLCMVSTSIGYSQKLQDKDFEKFAKASLPQLKDLLAIPNDAHHHEDIERNVKWCEAHFQKRGFTTNRLKTPTVPLLLAERKSKKANAPTVLIYLQVDGQPVDPNHWYQDNPYEATLKEKTADGDWMDMIAIEGFDPNFNMKVIMDFEEEIGSPNLPKCVVDFKKELASDMLVIFDGPRHITNRPTLTFGARGIATVTLKVFGPYFPQHSGHYGNYIPNPAVRLSQLIASMKDKNGRVTIPSFYDGITISDEVKSVLKSVPDDEKVINYKMGIASSDSVATTYQESLQYPSLNVRGMLSGWVGDEVRTIVPSSATAEIDVRLVLESDPNRLLQLIKNHIIAEGYHVIDGTPTTKERATHEKICQFTSEISYLAFRTEFDTSIGKWLDKALSNAFGETPIKQRTSGGSIPISPFVNELGIPAVTVPTVNRDNNQHSPNENIRLGNYIDGIKTIYYILKEPLK